MKTLFLVLGTQKVRFTPALGVAVLAGLLGCAAPASGPVAGADGTFSITREAQNSNTSTPAQITALVTQEAEAHCLKMSKKFKAIERRDTITRGYPASELRYACE